MPKQAYSLQVTFYYTNGEKESFLVSASADTNDPYPDLRQAIQEEMNQSWCALHTPEETIYVNMANVVTVSVKPSLGPASEERAFVDAQRVTALTHSTKGL
ncbi:MAG: hypothetical protein GVY17_13890 [Cyanobacteria bacterium]|jgi:hypothetical protein|nr:hypothetical protein [Cyanobacteria bacterium GSL.Bin21]